MQEAQYAQEILRLIDLTSLNYDDNLEKINNLCEKAVTPFGKVAAICIFSQFIPHAKKILNANHKNNHNIKIATVANFPNGGGDLEVALFETNLALERGADEVDIVFPYHHLIAGDSIIGEKMIKEAKKICNTKQLKVIIESGALKYNELIRTASKISIDNGADFIKTSTGKVHVNASIDAAEVMLNEIKNSKSKCGFKASGGIRTISEAIPYIHLAQKIMGNSWVNPNHFRFGASSLLNDVYNTLNIDKVSENVFNGY